MLGHGLDPEIDSEPYQVLHETLNFACLRLHVRKYPTQAGRHSRVDLQGSEYIVPFPRSFIKDQIVDHCLWTASISAPAIAADKELIVGLTR